MYLEPPGIRDQHEQAAKLTTQDRYKTRLFYGNKGENPAVVRAVQSCCEKHAPETQAKPVDNLSDKKCRRLIDIMWSCGLVTGYPACANGTKCVWGERIGLFIGNGGVTIQAPTYGMGLAACSMQRCRNQKLICLGCLITCIHGHQWDSIVCMDCKGAPPQHDELKDLAYHVVTRVWKNNPPDSVYRTPEDILGILKHTAHAQAAFSLVNVLGNKARLPCEDIQEVQRDENGHVMITSMNFMTYLHYNSAEEQCFPIWRVKTLLQSLANMFFPKSLDVIEVRDHSIVEYIGWILEQERALYVEENPRYRDEADNLLGTFMFRLVYMTVDETLVKRMDFARWLHKHVWHLFYVFNSDMTEADKESAYPDPPKHAMQEPVDTALPPDVDGAAECPPEGDQFPVCTKKFRYVQCVRGAHGEEVFFHVHYGNKNKTLLWWYLILNCQTRCLGEDGVLGRCPYYLPLVGAIRGMEKFIQFLQTAETRARRKENPRRSAAEQTQMLAQCAPLCQNKYILMVFYDQSERGHKAADYHEKYHAAKSTKKDRNQMLHHDNCRKALKDGSPGCSQPKGQDKEGLSSAQGNSQAADQKKGKKQRR